ncbi:DUF1656 domain-containing protein [Pseudomonas gingeri]|uniref:DUF1656 domain-containing protein n=1 Tax=Pseudomonas gingeri TaxID=117681 RepID=UPI0015A0599A|nr:DUF1656 domain-containing protein [Pseudomonas gingeri]NVZ27818.1 DUF1656 domain-containing protein [Pseudomonas gingeri]NWA05802.1 DUF1656 domain-containing protein [Pseudomonas gingeri]
MFREFVLGGVYVPLMTLIFFVAAGLAWGIGALAATSNVYRLFWHPALVRVSAFTCIFGALALGIYR